MTTTRRAITGIAVMLAVAGGPASVSARAIRVGGDRSDVHARSTPAHPAPAAVDGAASPGVLQVAAGDGGFDWGDAGIGAAAGVAISTLVLTGGVAVSQRRARRPFRSAA